MGSSRLANAAHTSHRWRIHELAYDFELEDVWALPTPGGADDFPKLVRLMSSFDPGRDGPAAVRLLFAIRWKLGELFGWDADSERSAPSVRSLRERLPWDLREDARGPDSGELPFNSLYLTDDEWALEIINRTVHGVLHLGWVQDGGGGYRGQMAILVRPNGVFGRAYMAAITPFRHLIVYPLMLRELERRWRVSAHEQPPLGPP